MSVIKSLEKLPIAPPAKLVGRTALFNQINNVEQAIFLYGMPGVGKRALAATLAANRIQAWQPVLWLSVNRTNLQTLASQVLRAFNVQPGNNADDMVNSLLAQHNPLIIINALASYPLAAQFIETHIKDKPVVVLHENLIEGPWQPVLVPPLAESDAHQLYLDLHPNADIAALPALLTYLQGHPLGIQLAALHTAQGKTTLPDLLAALPPAPNPLDAALGVIGVVFATLSQAGQGLLLAMSASFSSGISADLLNRMLGAASHQLCQTLVETGFITKSHARGALYYDLHPVVHTFAMQQLGANERQQEARHRMLEAIANFTRVYAVPNHERQYHPLILEMDNILNAALYSLESQELEPLEQIIAALARIDIFIHNWGYQAEFQRIAQLLHAAKTPATPADETLPTRPKNWDATLLETQISPQTTIIAPLSTSTALITPEQHLQLEFTEASARHDRPEMGRLAMQLGLLYLDRGYPDTALKYLEQAVNLYQDLGDLTNLLYALEILSIHTPSSQPALEYVQRGMNIARQLEDEATMCRFLVILGDIRYAIADNEAAMKAYKHAVKFARDLEDDETTGVTLAKLAAIYMDFERHREAARALSQAIAIFEQTGRLDLLGRALGNLGTALGYLQRWKEAGQRHAAALKIARELGSMEDERFQLENLAYVAEMEGHRHWAINYNRQALYLALLADDQNAVGILTLELGRLLMGEPELLGQAVFLLGKAHAQKADAETQKLLKEAQVRLRKRELANAHLAPVQRDLLSYAGEVYTQG